MNPDIQADLKTLGDDLAKAFAWALPRRVVYWAAMRLIAHATQGKWSSQEVPTLTAMDAVKRWEAGQ